MTVDTGLAPREGTPDPGRRNLRLENASLRLQIARLKEAMQARAFVKEMERFHCLDGLKDNICPCCGAAVNIVDNGFGTGVRIEARWKP